MFFTSGSGGDVVVVDLNAGLGLTKANRRSPKLSDVVNWFDEAWKELSMEGVKKKAKDLGMSAEPGPPVVGFVDKDAVELYNIDKNGEELEPAEVEDAVICDISIEEEEFEIDPSEELEESYVEFMTQTGVCKHHQSLWSK